MSPQMTSTINFQTCQSINV